MLSSSIPAELFLSEAHHFEHFALKSPKTIDQDEGRRSLILERRRSKLAQKRSSSSRLGLGDCRDR